MSAWTEKITGWWHQFADSIRRVPAFENDSVKEQGGDVSGNNTSSITSNRRGDLLLWVTCLLLFAFIFCGWLWWQDREFQALYGRNEAYDTAAVIECLERERINYRLHPDSGQVLVHPRDMSSARMALATSGIVIPVRSSSGRIDRGSSLGVSHFMERARFIRDLEDELARTIQGLDAVRLARVHLAVPEQSSFLRDMPGARASVTLDIFHGQVFTQAMIRGIVELVAGSIAGLDSAAVAVVDQSGRLLSAEVNELDEGVTATSQQLVVRRQVEQQLESQVSRLVEAVSGSGNYRVDVAVDLDFSNQESAWEDYGPEGGVLRSESVHDQQSPPVQELTQMTGSTEKSGAESGGQVVRNYEVNRSVNRVTRSPGRILYLSVAVLVDYQVSDEGEPVPWSEERLVNLQDLIKQAVGAREERADKVTVTSMPFYRPTRHELMDGLTEVQEEMMSPVFLTLAAVLAAILLVLLLLVIRFRSHRKTARLQAQLARMEIAARKESYEPSAEEQIPDAVSHEQLEARKKRLMQYAREDPDRVAMVLKQWMTGDERE